jgi:hypothetical protein
MTGIGFSRGPRSFLLEAKDEHGDSGKQISASKNLQESYVFFQSTLSEDTNLLDTLLGVARIRKSR